MLISTLVSVLLYLIHAIGRAGKVRVLSCALLSVMASALTAVTAHADPTTTSDLQGRVKRATANIAALGPDLLGDRINLFNGALEFVQTDVSLPGNNELSVAVSRRHSVGRNPVIRGAFGDWDLEVPSVSGTFASSRGGWINTAGNTQRCSDFSPPPQVTVSVSPGGGGGADKLTPEGSATGSGQRLPSSADPNRDAPSARPSPTLVGFSPFEYWQGVRINVPGAGSQEMLLRGPGNSLAPADGKSYPIVTQANWQIRCLPSLQNATGEGFEAISPDGVRYRFDWMYTRYQPRLSKNGAALLRAEYLIAATAITDRFGNSVSYNYDPVQPSRLNSVQASDGRVISFSYYGDGRVNTVFDGTRQWVYGYGAQGELQTVTLPDASKWEFGLRSLVYPFPWALGDGATCMDSGDYPVGTMVGTVKHPSGALGTFTTQYVTHFRSFAPQDCISETAGRFPRTFTTQTIASKTLGGPGSLNMTWQFEYLSGACPDCSDTRTLIVTEPNGAKTRNTYGVRFGVNEGHLLVSEEGWNGSAALRSTSFRYRPAANQAWPEPIGISITGSSDSIVSSYRPEDLRTTSQQGTTFNKEVTGFDVRARPLSVSSYSSLGYAKTEVTSYFDHEGKWVLGQLASVAENGIMREQFSYGDPVSVRPTAKYSFGRLIESYEWNSDGTLLRLYDPLNRAATFSNYFRGVPRKILHRDSTEENAIVNNLGNLASLTSQVNTTHSFDFDAMGRVKTITYPTGDESNYHPTQQNFEQVNYAEWGLPAGHWRQTITTGNAKTVRWFDALWRVRLQQAYDAGNPDNTLSYVETRYDAAGRKVFESYPSRSFTAVDAAIPGKTIGYDALNRVIEQTASSELGPLTTRTAYTPNFQRVVTNPRGHATTVAYQVFDTPSEDHITYILPPEGVTVAISRDVFGKPNSITRSGGGLSATRSYVYDGYQRLCKTIEPETGATVQAYDAANNIAWRASGLGLPAASCDYAAVPDARKVNFGYDALDRLTSTTYGDGSQNVSRGYTPDGLLAQIVALGGGVNTIAWNYQYNNRRLLTAEQYNWGDPTYGWAFNWSIDANGHVSGLTDPWGLMAYAPNALGQLTQVSGYASNVSYHPNGAVAGYTLANGISHGVSQNMRGLPELRRDAGVVQDRYAYDPNGNVTGITDEQEGASSRSMGYDGLDRLTAANGVWGAASFSYDGLDNLRSSNVGGRSLSHNIDPATNRLVSLSGSQNFNIGYDANGNITNRGNQGFVFDVGNRMRSAPGKAGFVYDGHGRRNLIWYDSGSYSHQAYTQDGKLRWGWRLGEWHKRYVYLGDKLIAEQAWNGYTTFSHTDALGSPVAKTDSAGQLLSRTRYEPYGATAAGSDPVGIGFTGHVNDPETGLVYMQQRYYDPVAGRFLSVDPVVTDAKTGSSFNRYVYGNNNPYKFKDPDGRFALPLIPLIIEAVATAVASNAGAAAVGIAGGVAIGAAINATSTQGDSKGAQATPPAAGTPSGSGKGATPTAPETRAGNVAKGVPESQLGPSGKPKIHVVDHGGDRKGAKDAARAEVGSGGTTTNHTSPAVGKDHYHGETQSGEKSRTHHEYK